MTDTITITPIIRPPQTPEELKESALESSRLLAEGVKFSQKCKRIGGQLPSGFDEWIELQAEKVLRATK